MGMIDEFRRAKREGADMGEVIYAAFDKQSYLQRQAELDEARQLADEFPDLVLAAPPMFDLLLELRDMWEARGEPRWQPLEDLFTWLEKRS